MAGLRDSTIAKVPVHARDLLLQLEGVMYARCLQTGARVDVPKHLSSQVVELRTRSYRRLDHALRVLQGFVIVVSQPYFSFIVPRLLALEVPFADEPIPPGSTTEFSRELLKDQEVIEKEPEDSTMQYYIIHTLHLILKANTKTNPHIESGVREFLFEFLLSKLSTANTLRRLNEISQCLAILSQYQLAELCQFIIGKLKTAKLSAEEFKLFQQTVREFDFGVARPMQRESTLLYVTYQVEAMEQASKDITRKEICDSLVYIFSKILQKDNVMEEGEDTIARGWDSFCKSNESNKFWTLIDDLYRNLAKWAKTQKGKSVSRYSVHRLMATIVGFSRNSTRDSFVDPLIRSVISQFKGQELCVILHDFLSNLQYSHLDTSHIPELFHSPLELIIDTLLQFSESVSEVMTNLVIDISIELGRLDIRHALRISQNYMQKDDLTMRFIGASILRIIAQDAPEELSEIDCGPIYECAVRAISGSESIVLQRDQELCKLEQSKSLAEDEKPQADMNEQLLAAALGCFPLIDNDPSKHLGLLERLSELSISPVFAVAESALYAQRDYILIHPGSHLVYALSLLLKQSIDYFQSNESHLRRVFYNASTLLYYINQAVENDFGTDGLNFEKLVLTRNQWEGTLLVWLCNAADWIHNIAWRLLEQLSSPQIRQLELNSQSKQIPHLVDSLPRPIRHHSAASLIPLLPEFFENQYDSFYLCVNWAWSNLYRAVVPLFLEAKSGAQASFEDKNFYFQFLCMVPRSPPKDASFETKHHFLSQSALTRWFSYIAVAIKERLFSREQLLQGLSLIHASCNEILLSCLFSKINIQNVSTELPNFDDPPEEFTNEPHVMSALLQLLLNVTPEVFNNPSYSIRSHYQRIVHKWFSTRVTTLNKLSLSTKRDLLAILSYCFQYSSQLSIWMPTGVCEDSHASQIAFITKIIKKILPVLVKDQEASPQYIAVDCMAVKVLLSICQVQSLTEYWEKWEDTCLSFCSRGVYLHHLTEDLFSSYIQKNPQRFGEIVHYAISASPAISQTPEPSSEYVLTLPLLRSIISCLRSSYDLFGQEHIYSMFFLSLYFQCSFDVPTRLSAIELASVISGREFESNQELLTLLRNSNSSSVTPDKKFPFLASVSSSFKDSFDTVVVSRPQFLASNSFMPAASHANREVYVALASRYSKEIAQSYPQSSRDILRSIVEFTNSLTCSTDIEMMLQFMRPWVANFGSSSIDTQTSRWIIRAVFELTYVYQHDESLTLCISALWEDLSTRSDTELRMALDWLIGFCAREIEKDMEEIDHDRITICCVAVGNLVRFGSERISQFAVSFLIDHLRDYSLRDFEERENVFTSLQKRTTRRVLDQYRERAVLMLLVPLVMGEKKVDYSSNLPLLLHHAFVVDRVPSDLCKLGAGDDLIANLLLGMEMRPSLIPKQAGKDGSLSSSAQVNRLKVIRTNYFPDSGTKGFLDSELNPFRRLQTPERNLLTSSDTIKLRGRKSKQRARSIDPYPLFVSLNKVVRFVDLLESVQPEIKDNWASLAFQWSILAPNIDLAVNSFAVYASITKEIAYDQIIDFTIRILRNIPFRANFDQLSSHFLHILKQQWFLLELKSFLGLTIVAVILLQQESKKLFTFGLEIFVALFQGEQCKKHFYECFSRSELAWKSSNISKELGESSGGESIDKIIVSYLFRGLTQQETRTNTLWLMGMIHTHVAQSYPSQSSYLLVSILLTNHVLVLCDRSSALEAYRSVKRIDQSSDVPSISGTFKKYYKDKQIEEYLELFYCEFASVYPDEEVFFFSLRALEDLSLTAQVGVKLAAIRALGSFLHLNYIHDISRTECQRIMDRVLVGIHGSEESKDVVDSLQTLLLFLLEDPRSNGERHPFQNLFSQNVLNNSPPFLLGAFYENNEDSMKVDELLQLLQECLQTVENTTIGAAAWHSKIMKEHQSKRSQTLLAEEETDLKVACDVNELNRQQRSTQKLYPVTAESKKRRKRKKGLKSDTPRRHTSKTKKTLNK